MSYSLKTNKSQSIEVSIYNHTSEDWTALNSINEAEFANYSHSIIDSNYRGSYNDIAIKIEGSNSTQFRLDLDYLNIKYNWIKTSCSENEIYSTIPNQSTDFTISNGTFISEGDLSVQDNNYTTFNSSLKTLGLTAQFKLKNVLPGDEISFLSFNYSCKTNITQLMNISLYNYTANDWLLIDTSSYTSFSNESYLIPISRSNSVNGSYVEYHDLFDSQFEILVRVECENQSSDFQLYIDKFVIQYQFIPYSFRSNTSSVIDAVEGDYVTFESSKYSDHYLGTYSFTDDEDGSDPLGWTVYEGEFYAQTEINVEGEIDGHKKVLSVRDPDMYAYEYCSATNSFESGQSYGTAEWWFRSASTESWQNTDVRFGWNDIETNNSEIMFRVYFTSNMMYITHSGGNTEVFTFTANTWYHLKFTWDATDGEYDGNGENNCSFYVDSVKKGEFTFWNTHDNVEKISIRSRGHTTSNKKVYFDAFGWSWSSNYTLGTNRYATCHLNESFELSLNNLDDQRINLFEACNIEYSLKTNSSQNVSLSLYNYKEESWDIWTSLITDNSTFYSGSYVFTNVDYISTDYQIKVLIYGINITVSSFELYLQTLQAEYNWSKAHADFGIAFDHLGLQIYNELCSWNSTAFFGTYVFENEGTFLLTLSAYDGYSTTKTSKIIEIIKSNLTATIGAFENHTIEDKTVEFSSNIHVSEENITSSDYKLFWNFGDGTYSNSQNPSHSYADSGVYNISLTVFDCFGNQFTDIKNITIIESAPKIVGPFTFHGIENQAIDLDVDIFDSLLDERKIEYNWYNSTDSLVSTDKKPSISLADGSYQYTLNVTDELDNTAIANISVFVEDTPPVMFISNYMYSGGSVSENEGFFTGAVDGPGELELRAYGYDLGNINDLEYYWTIISGNTSYNANDINTGTSSIKKFRVTETAVYLGQVKVVSSTMSAVGKFIINSFIDSNGNGISDELEELILEHYDNVSSYSDTDNDGLSDLYEIDYNITNYLDPDSDDDGLWDGIHNVTGIGEQSLSTKPNDPDCDDDLLIDGIEFYGWNITTDFYGQIVVNSDPWDNDTDGDGLSDYEEYNMGTHPRSPDSDNDGLGDKIDPYPTKYDYDGDGLSDKIEFDLGTALNVSDTDNDGLNDGEEHLGWFKTDPLSADSDHDFASDTAEMQNYKASIDDRYDMNDPISISFEVNCEKAASAQIVFMITFGEAINEPENEKVYGVQNVPELNVTIYKVDDDFLLFNLTSSEFNQTSEDNTTRYLSRVLDIRESIENNSLDYRGVYMIKINDTNAGCMLEQFDIEIAGYLDPWDSDFDNDGIMDGVEMGLLVPGVAVINSSDIYGENITIQFPMEETSWWTFDEGSGITATDLSVYENSGILTNMESGDWKTGKIGDYALDFDGVNEYIDCGNEYYLDFERNNTFSLSVWIKTSSVNGTIISKMNVSDNNRGYDLYCNENGTIRAHLISDLDSNELILDGSTTINDNQWHFIVITYDGSSNATGINIYIDGALDNLTTVANTLNKTIHTNTNLLIGSRTESDYFTGIIDDARIYSYALSQDNVTWLYNSGNGRPTKPLNGDSDPEVEMQYSLEIPYVGVVYDANLTISIESEGTPIDVGNITIEIVKEEINCSISDVGLSNVSEQFSNTTQFSYSKFIDITPYVNNNSITEYYGKFLLNIKIEGKDYRDTFIITGFYLQTNTFIEAGPTDTKAWCTNPAKFDTDDDGWSDYKELYIAETNPLSYDTDGDQVWDPFDRDPHQDVMLKITPISGSAPSDYKLVVVIKFTIDGTGDTYYIPTLKQKADVYENPLWTAYYDGTNGSPTELHYYVNINDDIRLPTVHGIMRFDLELWRVDRYWGIIKKWDKKLVSGIDCYTINEPGHSETLKVDKKDETEQVIYEAKVKVETIGIEKANTIAIYETNGTVFNGHYQEQERMNVIQLYVNDSGTGTPFEEGLNTIVIPTSLFTKTIFNAYVQNETLNETTIYSSDEEIFKFISVGRDGYTEQACEEIDFIIIRFDISSEDAMEVLNLLLECLVNETTNETAIVYNYVSTKENETTAVMMNLPFSVLGLIPWYCNFENSATGSKPETFEDWFWKPLATIGMMIVGVIVTIGMGFVELFTMMVNFFVAIFMDILPIFAYILWLIICALILIFIYIVFALTLITTVIAFLIMIGVFLLFSYISSMEINGNMNSITFSYEDLNLRISYKAELEFNHFLNTIIPIMIINFESEETYEFSLSFFSTSLPNFIGSFYENLISDIGQSSIPRTSSTEKSLDINKLLSGINFITGLFGGAMIIVGGFLTLPPGSTIKDTYIIIIGTLLFGVTFGIIIPAFLTANKDSPSYLVGMNIGIIIVFAIVSFLTVDVKTAKGFITGSIWFSVITPILFTVLGCFDLTDQSQEDIISFSISTILQTAWGLMTLITGALMIQFITDQRLKFIVQDVFIIITWITAAFIGGYSHWWINTHNN